MKQIIHPVTGKAFAVGGRRRPVNPPRMLHLHNYGAPSLLAPASCDYGPKAGASLRRIYLNDQLGDCVIAGGAHVRGVTSANATGRPVLFTADEITRQYHAIGGYVPGRPDTDQGCDEQTAFRYWEKHGWSDGVKLAGVISVSPARAKLACYLFENLFFGVELPDEWISPMPAASGFVWGVAGDPNPENGHCFVGHGYDAHGVKIDTWGMSGLLTWDGMATYAVPTNGGGGECYSLLYPDMIAKAQAKAPNGLNWTALLNDLHALEG